MTPEEKKIDAEHASQVLGNPVFRKCFKEIEETLIKQVKHVDLNDTEKQKSIVYSLQILRKIEDYFVARISGNQVAEYNAKQKERFSMFGKK